MTTVIKPPPPEIKNAIKVLIRRGADQDNLRIINDALSNPQVDDQCWQDIFNSQGAKDAIEQRFYSPEMIRLLTLQAMVLPETLLPFLNWLMAKEKKTDNYDISGEFQSKITKYDLSYCPKLLDRIYEGVVSIIPEILEKPKLISTLVWILKDRNGCWGAEYQKNVRRDLDKDLGSLKEYAKTRKYGDMYFLEYEEWKYIYSDIVSCLVYNGSNKSEKYEVLAKLFEELGDYEIAAVFYYVSYGKIPKSTFKKLSPSDSYAEIRVYQIKVKCKLTFIDFTFLSLGTIAYFIFQILKFAWFCAVFVFGTFFALGLLGLAIQNWPIVLFILFILGSRS